MMFFSIGDATVFEHVAPLVLDLYTPPVPEVAPPIGAKDSCCRDNHSQKPRWSQTGRKIGTPGTLRGPPGPRVLAALRRTGQRSFLAQRPLAHVVPPAQCWIRSGLPSETPLSVSRGSRYSTLARRPAPAICPWGGLLLRVIRHGAPTMKDDGLSRGVRTR